MNVLIISWDSSAAMDEGYIGDLPDRLIQYARYLSKIFVIAYSPKKMDLKSKKLSDNIFVYPTSSWSKISFVIDGYKIASRIVKRKKVDIVTCQDPLFCGFIGYLIKKRYKIPLIVQVHGDFLDNKFWLNERRINRILNILGKFIVRKADGVRTVSLSIKDYLESMNVDRKRIWNVPVYIFTDKLEGIRTSNNVRNKYFGYENIVLFVGRLSKQKNVGNLLKAAQTVLERFPETLFLIVGDGGERAPLEKLANDLNIEENVIFEGSVTHESISEYYNSCDMFVLPSNYEGRSRVVVEAMICRKPVISTETGTRDAIVDGRTGYIVPLNDFNALAEKIMWLLEHPEKACEMGNVGRQHVLNAQDIKKNAYKLREVYEQVTKEQM